MFRRNDPRLRRTLNEISQTIENANETAQTSVFVFGQEYISPCLSSIRSCFQPCVEHCFPPLDQRGRRARRRSRGRPELNFDFYDDWEEDENADLLGWDDEEYDTFVDGPAGYGTTTQQPGRQRAMSYGTRRDAKGRHIDAGPDGSAPGPSYFGFLGKITSKLGKGKPLRYKPSAAGLQEHPGSTKKLGGAEGEPLMTDESDADPIERRQRKGRKRSGTNSSGQTTSSLSSRGDLFPSEDEDDAVPLDDEFAMVLERRTTNSGQDDGGSSGIIRTGKRPGPGSRRSTRTGSSRSTPRSKRLSRTSSSEAPFRSEVIDPEMMNVPTLNELKQEEEQARAEEELSVRQRREAAQKLAAERGLVMTGHSTNESSDTPKGQEIPDSNDSERGSVNMTLHDNDTMESPSAQPLRPSHAAEEMSATTTSRHSDTFAAARLPKFGP
ncbi:hypothetical protein K461DRAFT_325563 [Myriangium duriaei CBS 260.36]|uniref:Uncharacterized protein n=1 Tax=Myriangium duriaei CBS 260.36 TaxID=1168546 RepID=A0A9P4JDE4_9PEZI|nr:hypothetical protein K461DRAFT_325563 [Myriangium duriaei CBS 260.36]